MEYKYKTKTKRIAAKKTEVGGDSEEVEMGDVSTPQSRRGSFSSVLSGAESGGVSSVSVCLGERVDAEDPGGVKKGAKKRRRNGSNECVKRMDEGMTDRVLEKMGKVGNELRGVVCLDSNRVSKTMIEFVMSKAAEYEGIIQSVIAENERLRGQNEILKESMKVSGDGRGVDVDAGMGRGVNVGMSAWGPNVQRAPVKSYALVVRGEQDMTSEQIKERVLKNVSPNVNVRVKAVRKIKNGGIAIEMMSERERTELKECGMFGGIGLKVELPKKIGPKVIVYDVPNEMSEAVFLEDLYKKNLKTVTDRKTFEERVKIVSRRGKRDASSGNIIVEMNMRACECVLKNERVYVRWNAFKVKRFETVQRCFACYGFGHMMKECKSEKLCRKCGEKGHIMNVCRKNECCVNCKIKGAPAGHSVMATNCPEYVRALERMREKISYD